jgi:hypothetical protein
MRRPGDARIIDGMSAPSFDHFDHRLHDKLVDLVFDLGPQDVDWLARRARRDLRDARIDEEAVIGVLQASTLLVTRPDGAVDHALAVLEGNMLTHRVRAPLAGRTDLWLGCGVQPLLNVAAFRPLVLADGSGAVRRAATGHDVLVGPAGWLPDVDRYQLIGLRVRDQRLSVEPVAEDDLAPPEEQLRARRMLSSIYVAERDFMSGDDDLATRPAELARSITLALLEDPALFATPYPPLDELLHNPMHRHVDVDHWRSVAVSQQVETVGFWIDGLPVALSMELNARARRYGMTEQQFIVAMLSTLAWRTPFAEDMEPWEEWDPETPAGRAKLSMLPGRDDSENTA